MEDTTTLDIRLPIGLLFALLGILLVIAGISGSFGVDIAWGAVMIVFGGSMLALARGGARRRRSA